jgi:hypothetical protein
MPPIIKPVTELAPGMLVAKNVEIQGTVLLTAGTVLSDSHIQRLLKWNVKSVVISDTNAESEAEEATKAVLFLKKEKERIEQLFSTAGEDQQMVVLKAAVLHHLEGRTVDKK